MLAGILTRRISRVFILDALEAPEPLFGEVNPDFAFAEIDLQGLPCLELSAEASFALSSAAWLRLVQTPL